MIPSPSPWPFYVAFASLVIAMPCAAFHVSTGRAAWALLDGFSIGVTALMLLLRPLLHPFVRGGHLP